MRERDGSLMHDVKLMFVCTGGVLIILLLISYNSAYSATAVTIPGEVIYSHDYNSESCGLFGCNSVPNEQVSFQIANGYVLNKTFSCDNLFHTGENVSITRYSRVVFGHVNLTAIISNSAPATQTAPATWSYPPDDYSYTINSVPSEC